MTVTNIEELKIPLLNVILIIPIYFDIPFDYKLDKFTKIILK